MHWCQSLAVALTTHQPPSPAVAAALAAGFLAAGVSEMRVVLAQGSQQDLSVYEIITGGAVVAHPLNSSRSLPGDRPTLAGAAVERVCIAAAPPPAAQGWADWEELQALGCLWALAAPLACTQPGCDRLLGAVVVGGGGGPAPGIDPHWLAEFACELAHAIAHASVTIMENSLDMLRAVFPPPVVTALVSNAVAAGGAPDAGAGEQLARAGGLRVSTSRQRGRDDVASGDEAPQACKVQAAFNGLDPGKRAQLGAALSSPTPPESPFAPLASLPSTSTAGPASPAPGSRSGHSSAASPPRRSPADLAVAALRQTSLRSDPSALFPESGGASPVASDLEGYEDLLREDAAALTTRRPSNCLERARSRDSMGEGESAGPAALAAALAALEGEDLGAAALEHVASGPKQAMRAAQGEAEAGAGGVTARDDSAVGPASPAAPLAGEAGAHALPRAGHPFRPLSASDSVPASVSSAPGSPRGGGGAEPRVTSLSRISEGRSLSEPFSSRSLSSRLASLLSTAPSGLPPPALLAAAAAVRGHGWAQLWDLEFSDPVVEHAFLSYTASRLAQSDSVAVCATVLAAAALLGLHPSVTEVATVASALPPAAIILFLAVTVPPAAATCFPEGWARRRAAALPPLRLLGALALAAVLSHLHCAAFHPLGLLFLGLMYPLTLRTHVPLQALCLWASTAAAGAGAPQGPAARLHQLAVGFLAPTLSVYVVERHLRRRFEAQLRWQLAAHPIQ